MMEYSKIYHGDTELQKLYRGDTLIWSKGDSSKMPVLTGVTDYFASDVGLTSSGWQNQIQGGDDITWHGSTGMEIQEDGSAGVLGTAESYGEFTSPYVSTRTVYCVFKSTELGVVRINRHILGSCGGSINTYRTGAWFTIATEHYNYYSMDNIQTDQWGIGAQSGVKCTDYHIVVLTRNANANNLFIDADTESGVNVYVGNSVAYGDNWGVGLLVDDYGNLSESPSSLQQIHFIALANAAHSAEQVAENSAWIRQHFLGV